MQTIQLKYDIISWITGLSDYELISKIHNLIKENESQEIVEAGIVPPRRKGSLTEGYGFWENDAQFNETNYRDILWQPKENVW